MAYQVMIVDDSRVLRMMLNRILQMVDIDISTILERSDGMEALETLMHQRVDLVLADINMPRIDGVELLRRMRAQPNLAKIPVIVITSHEGADIRDQMIELGVHAFVRKPFNPEEIRDRVKEVLR